MWQHTRLLEPDAKDGGDSSAPQDATGAVAPVAESSAAKGAEAVLQRTLQPPQSASPAESRAELQAKLATIMEKHGSQDEDAAPQESQEQAQPAKQAEEAEQPSKAAEQQPAKQAEEQPPFHEHPRWKEQQAKLAEANKQLEAAKPLLERQSRLDDYCRRFNLTEEQISGALEMAALLNTDPLEARKRLQPYVEALDRYTGERLPDDLAQKVKDGLVDEVTAKEMVALKARLELTEKRAELAAKQRAVAAQAAMQDAVTRWEQSKLSTDPDYKQKADLVTDRFVALLQQSPPTTPEAAVAMAERAFAEVNQRLGVFIPKPAAGRPGPNGMVAKKPLAPPKNALEAAQRALARHTKD